MCSSPPFRRPARAWPGGSLASSQIFRAVCDGRLEGLQPHQYAIAATYAIDATRLRTSHPTYAIDAIHFEANEGRPRHRRDGDSTTSHARARLRGAGWATPFRGAVATEHSARRRRVGTAVGWAVLLVSTSVEVCVARERARGLETRRSRELACRALCPAARRCSAACARALAAFWLPWVFCSLLRVRVLVLQVAWRGVGVSCLV